VRYEIDQYTQPFIADGQPNVNCVHSWRLAQSPCNANEPVLVIDFHNGWGYCSAEKDSDLILCELRRVATP
jgi:hypothetical protein